jgi:hypothetical protein
VTKLHKGQRVVTISTGAMIKGNGSWQEYICLDEEYVWPEYVMATRARSVHSSLSVAIRVSFTE